MMWTSSTMSSIFSFTKRSNQMMLIRPYHNSNAIVNKKPIVGKKWKMKKKGCNRTTRSMETNSHKVINVSTSFHSSVCRQTNAWAWDTQSSCLPLPSSYYFSHNNHNDNTTSSSSAKYAQFFNDDDYDDEDPFPTEVRKFLHLGSYKHVKSKWIKEVRHHCPDVPIILVGSKSDLRTQPEYVEKLAARGSRPVTTAEGQSLADEIGAKAYCEISSITQEGLKEMFDKSILQGLQYKSEILNPKRNTGTMKQCCAIMWNRRFIALGDYVDEYGFDQPASHARHVLQSSAFVHL